jgi:hypothetical protein
LAEENYNIIHILIFTKLIFVGNEEGERFAGVTLSSLQFFRVGGVEFTHIL